MKEPKYEAYRSTNKRRIMGDCSGSKKDYSFRLGKENLEEVHLLDVYKRQAKSCASLRLKRTIF